MRNPTAATDMHALDELSDESLAGLASQDDSRPFTVLAARHRAKALRVAYGILHNPADAEDAVQEAFVRIYRHLERFNGAGRFATWVYRVVVNESLRLRRARAAWSDRAERDLEQVPSGEVNAERVLIVRQCLAALPEKLRIVLALRGLEELDYTEIAAIVGIPVGTVRSRLHQARKQFAERWKEAMKDEM